MPTCEMHKDHPPDSELPPEKMLEHFLNCLSRDEQLKRIEWWREMGFEGWRCRMGNHRGVMDSQRQYAAKLRDGIREALEALSIPSANTAASRAYAKLKALIS